MAVLTLPSEAAVVAGARAGLQAICEQAGVDSSHGVFHASSVLRHAEAALAAAEPLPPPRALS
eukprot:1884338-Prymnesium_polylepis.1